MTSFDDFKGDSIPEITQLDDLDINFDFAFAIAKHLFNAGNLTSDLIMANTKITNLTKATKLSDLLDGTNLVNSGTALVTSGGHELPVLSSLPDAATKLGLIGTNFITALAQLEGTDSEKAMALLAMIYDPDHGLIDQAEDFLGKLNTGVAAASLALLFITSMIITGGGAAPAWVEVLSVYLAMGGAGLNILQATINGFQGEIDGPEFLKELLLNGLCLYIGGSARIEGALQNAFNTPRLQAEMQALGVLITTEGLNHVVGILSGDSYDADIETLIADIAAATGKSPEIVRQGLVDMTTDMKEAQDLKDKYVLPIASDAEGTWHFKDLSDLNLMDVLGQERENTEDAIEWFNEEMEKQGN